jgi:hypothetical protein
VHDLDIGNDVGRGQRHAVEVAQDALVDDARQLRTHRVDRHQPAALAVAGRVQRRDVDARHLRERIEQRAALAPIPAPVHIADLADRFLAVAEQHGVEEFGQRFRIERARAAGDHQRVARPAIGGAQRHAAEVEHGQEIGVGELVLETEPDDVELAQRRVGFDRDQGMARRAQHRLEVDPRRVDAFGVHIRAPVQQVVEQLQTGMRLRDLVDLGKGEGDAQRDAGRILAHAAELVAQVATRFLHSGE